MTTLAWAFAVIGWAAFFAMAYLARLRLAGWNKALELGFRAVAGWDACLATPTNTPPSAVTRDAAQGGATTSVPSLAGEGSGGTEASVGPPP